MLKDMALAKHDLEHENAELLEQVCELKAQNQVQTTIQAHLQSTVEHSKELSASFVCSCHLFMALTDACIAAPPEHRRGREKCQE